jgi:hypothetical protein
VTNPDSQSSTLVNGYDYTGIFVIVGSGAASSPDGITWTLQTIPAGTYQGVTWNGSIFAAVGASAAATSPDGVTWTSRTIPAGSYFAITYDGTNFIAIGNNISATSPDGITWTSHSIPVAATFFGITSNGSRAVAIRTNQSLTSDDHGVTWTAHSTSPVFGAWSCIAYNGLFCLGIDGTGSGAATSSDGVTWNSHVSPAQVSNSITFSGGNLVSGTPASGVALVSGDGINWFQTVYPPLAQPKCVAFNGSVFAGAGAAGVGKGASSSNGSNWTARDLPGITYFAMASNARIGSPSR